MKIRTKKNMTPEELAEAEAAIALSEDTPSGVEIETSPAEPEVAEFIQNLVHGPGNTKLISIKFHPDLLADLKKLAELDHMGYQTYIKMVLARHVRQIKDDQRKRLA